MSEKTNPTKIIQLVESQSVKKLVVNSLKKQDEFLLLNSLKNIENWEEALRKENPGIILLEYEVNGKLNKELLDEISLRFPAISIIAILPDDDPGRAQEALLNGARAFVFQPLEPAALRYTLQRVKKLQSRGTRAHVPESALLEASGEFRTFVIFSPRGGVGSSMLATNLALAINDLSDQDVLLVDGKQYFGHLDIMLNLQARSSIADLVPFAQRLDNELISDIVTQHSSGLNVLPSPTSFEDSQAVKPDSLYSIIQSVQKMYGYIVIDAGSALNENAVTLMDSAFRVLLLITPELASLHNAREFLEISQSLNFPDDKILLVLNRTDMKDGVRVSQIEEALPIKLFGKIPEDNRASLKSINQGIPLYIKNPKSPLSKSLKEMSKRLMNLTKKEIRDSAFSNETP